MNKFLKKSTSFVVLLVLLFAVSCATSVPVPEKTEVTTVKENIEKSVEKSVSEPVAVVTETKSNALSTDTLTVTPVLEEKEVVPSLEGKVEEVPVKEEPKEQEFTHSYIYSYEGYDILVDLHNGYGYVEYPSFITDSEINEALQAFVAEYGDFGVTYEKVSDGKLKIEYEKDVEKGDFDYLANLASSNLTWYLDQMFKASTEIVPAVVAEAEAETEVEAKYEEIAIETPIETPLEVPEEVPVKEEPKKESQVSTAKTTAETKVAVSSQEQPEEQEKGDAGIWIILIMVVLLAGASIWYFAVYKKKQESE